jgi:hypothetical protein
MYTSLLDILLLKWAVDLPAISVPATCLEMSIRPNASMSHGYIQRGEVLSTHEVKYTGSWAFSIAPTGWSSLIKYL